MTVTCILLLLEYGANFGHKYYLLAYFCFNLLFIVYPVYVYPSVPVVSPDFLCVTWKQMLV